ncbi:DUF2388 domain-containing protein [Pseudomonas syringae]|nr:DUF2388 domain-containing protein [Pseudomonas syringae]MCF5076347.1 DUF2388 domain-containing protein [Pseudomonas syringae]MCF5120853.1 DUF2388 domain-containing protein [Pseudomonas syringae]MCF5377964.1 DUF2388 domain-containing protein [Pseudomonas syringae]
MASQLLLLALALSSLPLVASDGENRSPLERATMVTTGAPFLLTSGTAWLTSKPFEMLKAAKSDALAFIGSDGDIRGAQFELAVRTYHRAYPAPHMDDMQLAQAIAVTD